jgi:hypothetical protein
LCAASSPGLGVEGPTAAGPIGGTDVRSAALPPPGLYGGAIGLAAATRGFVDGSGKTIPALADAYLEKQVTGPFLLYVPAISVLGGSVGIGGVVPIGNQCGHLNSGERIRCTTSVGDPYIEIDWSRSFGKLRPSKFAGAYPIFEGLSVLIGLGAVLPLGGFDTSDPTEQALSIGNNTWDIAPSFALTYTTAPIFADGTEFSGKVFWNNYFKNPTTQYLAGDLLNLDFAITERIGRVQAGLAGVYATQIEDDRLLGREIPPDGRRAELLMLGGVVNYDMPEHNSSVRVKALSSVLAENTVGLWVVVLGWARKY